jgi:hypothetical protein
VCPPLLGLHTMAAGVRCAVGDCESAVSTVCIVDSHTRSALSDGSIGNVWVAMAQEHVPVVRGPGVPPLQWTFDPNTRSRSGPFRVSGALRQPSFPPLTLMGCVLYPALALVCPCMSKSVHAG